MTRALLLSVLATLSSCSDRSSPSPPSLPPAASIIAAAPATAVVAKIPERPRMPAADCLCDDQGLPMMAQITKTGVRSGGVDLPLFAPFYYVFAREPEEGVARSYTLGTSKHRDSICAKVPADAVALWSTVVGACPLGRVNVYSTFEQVEQLARTGATSEPMAVTPSSSQRRPFLWPLVETRSFHVGDVEQIAWRIHFLGRAPGGDAAPAAPPPMVETYSAAEVGAFQHQLRGLDVAWVVDATGSMDKFWNAARQQVAGISKRLAKGGGDAAPDVRFGLVAFRDHDTNSEFAHRSTPFTDERPFLQALSAIPIDNGGDVPEAGLDALDCALDLDWRKSSLTTRVLVIVSDASFHEGSGEANPRDLSRDKIVARARQLGVHVFGLMVGQQAKDEDRELQAKQYRDLADRTGGSCFAIEDAEAAVQRMEVLLQGAAQDIQKRQAVMTAVAAGAGSAADISNRTSIPAEEVTEALEFLAGAIDLKRLKPGEPAFASGWVLPNFKGERLLDMRVLMSRGDCELLRDACRRLIADLADRPEVGERLVGLAVGGRSALGVLVDDERADIATYLAARHRLVFRPDSVLRLSQAQLRHMPEMDRRRRLDQVALALRGLLDFERDDRNFFMVNGTAYGFAAEEVLP